MAIVTRKAIETNMPILTAIAIETDIYHSGIEPGINCKELILR